ncbi:hypothetical protein [Leifsonia sp. AG29]|uniref:hypothetical protein n=1 Tax=Leifsonia sp. AG29 TaxID=2598860 RepID=UPI00131D1B0A|nr:hypothetical protein [Leifsonia sp. AG29]
MDDLRGTPQERLAQLDRATADGSASTEWLVKQLRTALEELVQVERIADEEAERREDF